jgi:Mn-dependent DtxR family transcriptional regulator
MNLLEQKKNQLERVMARAAKLQEEIKAIRKQNRICATCIRLREVARLLGVSGQTVLRMVEDHRLKGYRRCTNGPWWITKRSLQKLHDALSTLSSTGNKARTDI